MAGLDQRHMFDRFENSLAGGKTLHAGGEGPNAGENDAVGLPDDVWIIGHRNMASQTGLARSPLHRLFDGAQIAGAVINDRQGLSHGRGL